MIFNEIFDHIYVLNLKESVDRKNHIEREFKRVGITKYDFFEAVSYNSEEAKNMMNSSIVKKFPTCFKCHQIRCNCENNFLTPFQIANWCSFLNIFKDIIKNNYNFVLICEDDIVFSFQYEHIINKLLSKNSFKEYNINMNLPFLLKMGAAFNPDNHNSKKTPFLFKNFALCNPCFAINKLMASIYLQYLTIIDDTSDVYIHKKIPKYIKGIQYYTMFPYPIYELSFVKSMQKFNSLIRPINGTRRIEYKDFLFLTSNRLLNIYAKDILKLAKLDIHDVTIGFNGNIDYFIFFNEDDQKKYYFNKKILLMDDYNNDIRIIYFNIKNKVDIAIYNLYLLKIKATYDIEIDLYNTDNLLKSVIIFYNYLTKLFQIDGIIKININQNNDYLKFFLKNNNLEKYFNKYIFIRDSIVNTNEITDFEIENIKILHL